MSINDFVQDQIKKAYDQILNSMTRKIDKK